jgi:hypothetical protein
MISNVSTRLFYNEAINIEVLIFGLLSSALLLWRALKFHVLPLLHKDDPKEYPYWIPVVGHLRSFSKNSQALLTRARLYFGDTREPFSITMGGQTFYIVTKDSDVRTVFRNSTSLTFEIFAQEILNDLGCSQSAIKSLYGISESSNQYARELKSTSPAKITRQLHHHQLFPGNLINDIGADFIQYFEKTMTVDYLKAQEGYATPLDDDTVTVSLFALNSDIFTNAAQEAYFGSRLRTIEPNMAWTMLEFDDLAWQLLFKYPPFLSRRMRAAKDKAVDALEQYFACPQTERTDTAWFTPTFETEMRKADLNNRDLAISAMTIYWGATTNLRKGAFWFIAHLLFDQELLAAVLREIAPAFTGQAIDQDHLTMRSPRFRGAWEETMRITAYSSSVRYVTEDTVIGGTILRKDYRIMMPYRQMHLDSSIFGDRVEEFVSERFVKNPNLRRHNMTFGGGATQCPGRHLATHAILIFVAMLFHRFDVSLDPPNQKFPVFEEAHPVLGIVDVKRSTDLRIKLRLKK